jgi:hypothetical protein
MPAVIIVFDGNSLYPELWYSPSFMDSPERQAAQDFIKAATYSTELQLPQGFEIKMCPKPQSQIDRLFD